MFPLTRQYLDCTTTISKRTVQFSGKGEIECIQFFKIPPPITLRCSPGISRGQASNPSCSCGTRCARSPTGPTGNGSGLLDPANQTPDVKLSPINPRAQGDPANTVGAFDVQGPGLQTVSFRGAFGPSIFSPLWTNDWTAINVGGIVGN